MVSETRRTEQDLGQGSSRWRMLFAFEEWAATPMAILSTVWLGIAVLELTRNSNRLLDAFGLVIWAIFVVDFVIRIVIAPHKTRFLKRNALTLVALVVPALRLFRIVAVLRAASIARGANLVRVLGVVNRSMNALRKTLRRRAFGYVFGLTAAVLFAGAAGMYNFEPSAQVHGGFTSYWDALWWTAMLLTSIGSQYWPNTAEGRILGFMLALYGLGILGYMTATIASFFIGQDADRDDGGVAGTDDIDCLRKEIERLRESLSASSPSQREDARDGGDRPAIPLRPDPPAEPAEPRSMKERTRS